MTYCSNFTIVHSVHYFCKDCIVKFIRNILPVKVTNVISFYFNPLTVWERKKQRKT